MPSSDMLVLSVDPRQTQGNKPYLALQVRLPRDHHLSQSGVLDYPAKIWSDTLKKVVIPKPQQVISADYKEDEWNGALQFILNTFLIRPEGFSKERFLPSPVVNQEVTYQKLFAHKWQSNDLNQFFADLRKSLEAKNCFFKNKLLEIPAGAMNHHSSRAGLLQHMEEMWDFAEKLLSGGGLPHFEGLLDEEVLLASILMHDLGKIHEYDPFTYQYNESRFGAYLGHTNWAAYVITSLWKGDRERMLRLVHAVLAHHGTHATGASVEARTPEATVLHLIDSLSARLDVHRRAELSSVDGKNPGFSKMLGGSPITGSWPVPLLPTHSDESK